MQEPKFEFSYNEEMLIAQIFNNISIDQPSKLGDVPSWCYGKYNGIDAAIQHISSNHIWICYFIGNTYRYTDTRKIRLIQYIDNKYVKFDETTETRIKQAVHKFYYEYLPIIEMEIYKSGYKLDENILKYKIDIVNGEIKIRYDYLA